MKNEVFLRLLSYAQPHKKILTIAFLFLLIGTTGEVVGPLLVKKFIDDHLTTGLLHFWPIFYLAVGYILIQVCSVIFNYFQLYLFHKTALHIIQEIRMDVFSKVQQLGMKFFDKTSGGSLVSRITNDTEAIKELFVSVLSTFLQSGVFLLGIFIAMFTLNVQLAIFCLVLIPIILGIMAAYRKLSSNYYFAMREQLSQLNSKLSESIQGMMIIQAFRQEKRLRDEFAKINNKYYHAGLRNLKLDGLLLRPAMDLLYTFTLVLILNYFGITSLAEPIEIGVLYVFVNYLDRFFEPVNQAMMKLSMFQQAQVSATRVFTLIDESEMAPKGIGDVPCTIEKGSIEFKNVSFSYDEKTKVLRNISFTAKPGETIALVGHTGSGKSSIINLLMRFYDQYEGEILIDGISLKEFQDQELRHKVGLVLQDPFLFVGDIKQNIRLYNRDLSEEDVIAAAKFVQADSFIQELPGGYDYKVGERGSSFSSGQRQLIAFARTMAMKPKVLILDEATANIDTQTEELIQQSLNKMRVGRTTIAIAHRLSTIQDADEILVLHHGEVVERGSHQQLLEKNGLYYKMYRLQHDEKVNKVETSKNTE